MRSGTMRRDDERYAGRSPTALRDEVMAGLGLMECFSHIGIVWGSKNVGDTLTRSADPLENDGVSCTFSERRECHCPRIRVAF